MCVHNNKERLRDTLIEQSLFIVIYIKHFYIAGILVYIVSRDLLYHDDQLHHHDSGETTLNYGFICKM